MVHIAPFAVEQWMDKYELDAKYNIAETCCDSISLSELYFLSQSNLGYLTNSGQPNQGDKSANINFPFPVTSRLTYGAIRGSQKLRENIVKLYVPKLPGGDEGLKAENVLLTQGAIGANFLLFYSLIGPGDHVICVYPCYQALYGVAESLGAEVSFWKGNVENSFLPDIDELRKLVKSNTKLIVINNPNNPTGAVMSAQFLQQIAQIAKENGNIPILSDEVYRPVFHKGVETPPSIIDIYSHGIATGSLSKAYSLAGIRVGWIASRQPTIIEACAVARDYNTISVSSLDDFVATYALTPKTRGNILSRNLALATTNLSILDDCIQNIFPKGSVRYVKPQGGTTAFVQFLDLKTGKPLDDQNFCEDLIKETGVMVTPGGSCFGEEYRGYVRIGYACDTPTLETALSTLNQFLRKRLEVPE